MIYVYVYIYIYMEIYCKENEASVPQILQVEVEISLQEVCSNVEHTRTDKNINPLP